MRDPWPDDDFEDDDDLDEDLTKEDREELRAAEFYGYYGGDPVDRN